MKHLARQIHNHILQAKKIAVIPHQSPDGDAMGSASAFFEYLLMLKKDAVIFCITPVNSKLHFVPHSTRVAVDPMVLTDQSIGTMIVLDSGDLRYAGVDKLLKNHPATIIVIDHHATNEHYGHLNLVNPMASSTSEILYHYFHVNHITINQKMATALLAGLTTDTGNFTNAATSASALAVGSELVRFGGNMNLVKDATLKNKSVDALRLWGKALSRLTRNEKSGITYTYVTQADLKEHNATDNESEGIANFLNNLDNAVIALILKELPDGKVKGSFRTTRNDVDVAAIAKKFGGGGHKKAAGFTLEGTIDEVLRKILGAP